MLLFQAMTDAHRYEGVLEEFGFECYVEGGSAFYAQQEIRDVLNLLRCTHSGADEIALVGVLRSPFFAIADETIFWLAQYGRTVDRTSPVSCGLFSGQSMVGTGRERTGESRPRRPYSGGTSAAERSPAGSPLDHAGDQSHGLRCDPAGGVPGPPQAGQPAKVDRAGPGRRRKRAERSVAIHSRTLAIYLRATAGSTGDHRLPGCRRGAVNDDSPVEGPRVSGGGRAGRRTQGAS